MSQRKLQKTSRTYVVAPQNWLTAWFAFTGPRPSGMDTSTHIGLYHFKRYHSGGPSSWGTPRANCMTRSVRLEPKSEQVTPGQHILASVSETLRYLDTQMPRYPGTQIHDGCRGVRKRRTEGVACTLLMSTNWAQVAFFFSAHYPRSDRAERGPVQLSSVPSSSFHPPLSIGVKIKDGRPIIKTSENQASTVAQETANERISQPGDQSSNSDWEWNWIGVEVDEEVAKAVAAER